MPLTKRNLPKAEPKPQKRAMAKSNVKSTKETEADLAAFVIQYLEERDYDVYQEVPCNGGVADIVAVKDETVWIIECKKALGLPVLEQAWRRRASAHLVSVATRRRKRAERSRFAESVMREKGIGYLEISNVGVVKERFAPKLKEKAKHASETFQSLRPEHKTYARAGEAGAGHWSPFKETCRNIRDLVTQKPGITLTLLLNECSHHYASRKSAHGSIVTLLKTGAIPGVEAERNKKRIYLFPATPRRSRSGSRSTSPDAPLGDP